MKLWLYPVINRLRRGAARSRAKKNPTGERMTVRRGRLPDTEVLFYRPTAASDGPLPTLFLLHGGSWVLGSAPGCDMQARLISDLFGAAVVSVDYQMLYERPFPYQQTETADTVEYFLKNADAYGLDPERFALLGFSAGGHIAAGADMLLRGRGIKLYKVMLCYPFLDFVGFTLSDYAKAKGKTKRIIDKGAEEKSFPHRASCLRQGRRSDRPRKNLRRKPQKSRKRRHFYCDPGRHARLYGGQFPGSPSVPRAQRGAGSADARGLRVAERHVLRMKRKSAGRRFSLYVDSVSLSS